MRLPRWVLGDWSSGGDRRKIFWEGLTLRVRILMYLVAGLSLAGYAGQYAMPLELCSHLRVQYLAFSLLAVGLFWYRRAWKTLILAAFFVVLNAIEVIPIYLPRSMPDSNPSNLQLKLLLANVQFSNKQYDPVIKMIRNKNADIVVLEEFSSGWLKATKAIEDLYPHRISEPREDGFGIALFTRVSFQAMNLRYFGESEVPSIVATLRLKKQNLLFLATHPLPPAKRDYFPLRNQQLSQMAVFLKNFKGARIVLGDLNCSPWSPYFRDFLSTTGLVSARQGFGIVPTWPTVLPPAAIPVDHCLVDPSIRVNACHSGPRTGSDHLPLIVELEVPE